MCRLPLERTCCCSAELCALFMTVGSLSLLGRGQVMVQFSVESPAIARRIFLLLQRWVSLTPQLHYVTHARFGGRRSCVLTLSPLQTQTLLIALGMMDRDESGQTRLLTGSPKVSLNKSCCQRSFLRGAMLGSGTVTSPDKGYHLELSVQSEALGQSVAKCLQRLNLPVKRTARKEMDVFYLKQSDQIATLLSAIGAHRAVTQLEELRVRKQVLGTVNRAMNCDSANLQKQMDASEQQTAVIERLMRSERFGSLPPALQEIARERLSAPDASLTELGQRLDPPIGKSGVNHRMRRLMEIAKEEQL